MGGGKDNLSVVELKDALGVSPMDTTDMPAIKWRKLKSLEKEKLASKVFTESANLSTIY